MKIAYEPPGVLRAVLGRGLASPNCRVRCPYKSMLPTLIQCKDFDAFALGLSIFAI